jgi:hypothetical protein
MALIFPSPRAVQGELQNVILPLDADATLNSGETGSVVSVDVTAGDVEVTLPPGDEVTTGYGFYFYVCCGANTFTITPNGSDTIDSYEGYEVIGSDVIAVISATSSGWTVGKTSGSWSYVILTTTTST